MKKEGILHLLVLLLVALHPCRANVISPPPNEICDNGIDDDFDGLVDCYDPDCCDAPPCADTYFSPCLSFCQDENTFKNLEVLREWTSPGNNWHPYNTPLAADLDGDGAIEIIGNRGTWQGLIDYKNLLVIDGESGTVETVINTPWFRHVGAEMCFADVDQNGRADIFFRIGSAPSNDLALQKRMICYEYDGSDYAMKWISDSLANGVIPSLADFNQDQIPELYIGTNIFNSLNGALLVEGDFESSFGLGFSVAADVLPDNYCNYCEGLELVVGNEVYAVHIDPSNAANNRLVLENRIFGINLFDGFTSLSDMDADGDLDAIVSSPDGQSQSTVYIWDIQEARVLARFTFSATTNGWASLPCIRDIDRDQIPEIAISSNGTLRLLDFDGENLEERWQIQTEDWSSRSGATIFDLNGDGHFEILHRDQDQFRILNADNGEVLFSDDCISSNLYEHPVVVDVDQDGAAEVLCSCESELRAYGSAGEPWVSTRSIWNQYNYYYTNINDDLTIPIQQQSPQLPRNGQSLNAYLNQYSNQSNISYIDIDLPPSLLIERGQEVSLQPTIQATPPFTLMWTPDDDLSCNNCAAPIASPSNDQQYTVILNDANGCSDTASVGIHVMECGSQSFALPNAFTPDDDGFNDLFEIYFNTDLPIEGSIAVFNRWGQRVFSSNNLTDSWDGRINGRLAPSDVYLFMVSYRCADGVENIEKGTLTLIR
ncbi:MAG: FG-GAP-like repeat-containing protein [Bacteroidota bacterium]